MIGETNKSMDAEQNKGFVALRDAVVVFFLLLITKLLELGYPPTPEAFYFAFLGACLMAIISYMHALGIKKPAP